MEILVLDLVRGISLRDAFEQVYEVERRRLSLADAVVFRAPVAYSLDPEMVNQRIDGVAVDDPNRKLEFLNLQDDAFSRFPDRPAYLLFSHGYRHYLSRNINAGSTTDLLDALDVALRSDIIGRIRDAEIDFLVEQGRARLPAIENAFYRSPSGYLVRSFLRVGNIQRSRFAIDALFFWLLPYFEGTIGIITDTWSIGSVAINASRRLGSYGDTLVRPCPVEMLTSYFDGSETHSLEAAEHIDRFLSLAEDNGLPEGKITFVLSGISTGELHKRLQRFLENRGSPLERIQFVALFNLGMQRATLPCLRDLSKEAGDGSYAAVASDGGTGVRAIEIDPQTYFPAQYVDIRHVVRSEQIRPFTTVLKLYEDVPLIKVHRDVVESGERRHQAIWVDTVALCAHPEFKSRLIAKFQALMPSPALVITPDHEAGKVLAKAAMDVFGSAAQYKTHPTLRIDDDTIQGNKEIAGLIDGLSEDGAILILDDAFITGRRLIDYQRHLRARKFRGRIHYLVAIARPPLLSEWRRRCWSLRYRPPEDRKIWDENTAGAIHEFVLPEWRERDCPWCQESDFFKSKAAAQVSAFVKDRVAILDGERASGLEDGLFIVAEAGRKLTFTSGSLFGELTATQAAIFAAVASALQVLREPTSGVGVVPQLGPKHFPVSTVVDDLEYLKDTFTDSLLRACFLRATFPYELIYAAQDSEEIKTGRALDRIKSGDPTERDIGAEIIYACLQGRFPELMSRLPEVKEALGGNVTEVFRSWL